VNYSVSQQTKPRNPGPNLAADDRQRSTSAAVPTTMPISTDRQSAVAVSGSSSRHRIRAPRASGSSTLAASDLEARFRAAADFHLAERTRVFVNDLDHRFGIQKAIHVTRQVIRCLVPARAILLHGLHDDPIEIASQLFRELHGRLCCASVAHATQR